MTKRKDQDATSAHASEIRKQIALLIADGVPRTAGDIQTALKLPEGTDLAAPLRIMSRWGLIQSEEIKQVKVWTMADTP